MVDLISGPSYAPRQQHDPHQCAHGPSSGCELCLEWLDSEYSDEDCEVIWFMKRRYPTRSDAKQKVMSEFDWDEWVRIRCRSVWMEFYRGEWEGYDTWLFREVPKGTPGAQEGWRLEYV